MWPPSLITLHLSMILIHRTIWGRNDVYLLETPSFSVMLVTFLKILVFLQRNHLI